MNKRKFLITVIVEEEAKTAPDERESIYQELDALLKGEDPAPAKKPEDKKGKH